MKTRQKIKIYIHKLKLGTVWNDSMHDYAVTVNRTSNQYIPFLLLFAFSIFLQEHSISDVRTFSMFPSFFPAEIIRDGNLFQLSSMMEFLPSFPTPMSSSENNTKNACRARNKPRTRFEFLPTTLWNIHLQSYTLFQLILCNMYCTKLVLLQSY